MKDCEESEQVAGDVNLTVDKKRSTVLVEKSEEESNDLETEKLLKSLLNCIIMYSLEKWSF